MNSTPFPGNEPYQPGDGFAPGGFNIPPGASGNYPPAPRGGVRTDPSPRSKRSRKDKAPKTATKRLLTKQKIFALLFAVIAVGLALSLTSAEVTQVFVVRTTTVVPALSTITGQYEIVPLPQEAIEEGAVSGSSEEEVAIKISGLLNTRTRMALPKGHQIHPEDFSVEVELANPLQPYERILAVEASVVSAIGGQLRAGDRVDVIAVIDYQGKTYSNVVASDVEIITALPSEQQFNSVAQAQASGSRDKGSNELLPADPVPGIYNVRVDVNQAVILAAAQSRGDLVLVLRGASAVNTPVSVVDLEDFVTNENPAAGLLPPLEE